MFAFRRERTDSGIRELLPPLPLVTARLRRAYGKCRVQEEYSLFCPMEQVRVGVRRPAQVALYLLEDILERRGSRHAFIDGETEPVRLPMPVIRILPKDDDLHVVEWTHIERAKNMLRRGEHRALRILFFHEQA